MIFRGVAEVVLENIKQLLLALYAFDVEAHVHQ